MKNAKSSYDWRRLRGNAVCAPRRDSLRPVPSAISHAAPALAIYPLFRSRTPPRLWLLGVACAIAPDLDVLAFRFGIPYEDPLGHRGLSHSIPFAALFAALLTLAIFAVPR